MSNPDNGEARKSVYRGGGRPTADTARQKAENIIAAASASFCRHGYRAVTMRQIAAEAQVSTRTLYNRYADKFSLFVACLEAGSASFPVLDMDPGADPAITLRNFAVAVVKMLSSETSESLGILVIREGTEFPELMAAAEQNQNTFLVQPMASFLRLHALDQGESEETAKILLAMMLSAWQRRVSFHKPKATEAELEDHASRVIRLFFSGVAGPRRN